MKKSVTVLGSMMLAVVMLTACGLSNPGKAGEAGEPLPQTGQMAEENTVTAAEQPAEENTVTAAEQPAEENTVTAAKQPAADPQAITVAAAASLETCLKDELFPLFEEKHPGITVVGTYDSSGKLQTQIEEGADVDVFFSAAEKQMKALDEKGMIADGSIVKLLENKIVFIVPAGEEGSYSAFTDIVKAEHVAIGDPESVPAGQYAKEALMSLGLWDQVLEKASLGTNVTEILNWVAEGSAEAGIVYATDAAQTDKVTVVAEAPEGSVKKVIYPVGIIKESKHQDAAKALIEFFQSEEAMEIFRENGFAAAE